MLRSPLLVYEGDNMQYVKLAVVAASCVAMRSAAAQPTYPPPPPPPPAAPTTQSVLPDVLSTLGGGSIEARMDYTHYDDSVFDLTVFAFNIHGQYISPSGLGGYAALPFAFASTDDDSQTAIGNIELGGLYVFRQPDLDFYLRGGFAANTASEEGTFLLPAANGVPRLADAITTGADSNWVRGGAGIRATSGSFVLGGSGMFNVLLDELDNDALSVLTLTGSLGIQEPGFGIAASVAFYQVVGDEGSGDNNTLGINLVGDVPVGPRARLFGAAGFNPDNEFDGFSIGFGVRAGM